MAITTVAKEMAIIAALADLPNATDGLTAAQLKAKFDEGGLALKTYINGTLIPALESTIDGASGADQIGATDVTGLTGATVQTLIESLKTYVDTGLASNAAGDHTGTWQGYSPSQVDQTLRDQVEVLEDGTVTGAYNAKGYGLVGDNTTNDYTALSALLTTIGANQATIIIPSGTYKLSSNITIPSNVTLWFLNGAMLSPDTGVIVTINGSVKAGLYQIFTGDGSVVGSPKNKAVHPEWFGLNASSTNNAPGINKAIQFLPITGGTVEFGLGGWYEVTESIVVNKSAVRIKGQGTGNSTNILAVDHTFNIITTDFSATQIEDLSISATNAVSSAYAIYSTNSLRVDNVSMNGVYSGIYSSGPGVRISNVTMRHLKASSGIGIDFAEGNEVKEVHSVIMENESLSNAFAGIRITGGSGYTISNCQLLKMGVALYINASTSHIPSIAVSNTWFDTSNYGVRLLTSNNKVIQRIRFSNCWFGGNAAFGLQILQGFVKGLTVENSEFFGNTNDGFRIEAASVDGIKINSCSIAGNGGSGISMAAGVSNFMITNNRVGPCADFGANANGISVAAGASDHYVITGNDAHGNTSGQINDSGTGTNKVVANNLIA